MKVSFLKEREKKAKFFALRAACHFHVCKFFELANAKLEDATLRVVLRGLPRPQRREYPGFEGGAPFVRFLGSFFVG